jgi:hypothetical protein
MGFDPDAENLLWLTWCSEEAYVNLWFKGPYEEEKLKTGSVLYLGDGTTEELTLHPEGPFALLRRLLGL